MTWTPEIITGLTSLLSGAFFGMMANNQKLLLESLSFSLKANAQGNANANDAANRNKAGSSVLQRVIAILICGVLFGGALIVALTWLAPEGSWMQGVKTSYIYEEAGGRFLGIFGSGREKIKVLTAEGFVIPPYAKYSVISIVNFLFGASVVKLRRV